MRTRYMCITYFTLLSGADGLDGKHRLILVELTPARDEDSLSEQGRYVCMYVCMYVGNRIQECSIQKES